VKQSEKARRSWKLGKLKNPASASSPKEIPSAAIMLNTGLRPSVIAGASIVGPTGARSLKQIEQDGREERGGYTLDNRHQAHTEPERDLAASVTVPGAAQSSVEANRLRYKTTTERSKTMKEMRSVVHSAPFLLRMEYYRAMDEIRTPSPRPTR
jgi:hypothetical protein